MEHEEQSINYAEMMPEYDMEFISYGPNTIDMPLSPPSTPPPPEVELTFHRELSPFSDATSMTSVDSTDSIGYYREESGRMFPAMPDVPLVLPVDNAEMRRISGQYNVIKLVTGDFHREEIEETLNPPYEASIRVLDVIANSPWIDEMADQFPHVKFTGCNFVPTRHPHHPNIQLEIYNLNEGFRGRDEYYDLIRMEGCFKTTRDFKSWLKEMHRLLKPGGILIVIDLEMAVWMRDGSDPWRSVPTLCSYTDRVHKELKSQGIDTENMPLVGTWLRELGGFSDIDDTVTCVPVGGWDTSDEFQRELGELARDNIVLALIATHPLLRRSGKTPEETEALAAKGREELHSGVHMFERLFYCFARKEEVPFEGDF